MEEPPEEQEEEPVAEAPKEVEEEEEPEVPPAKEASPTTEEVPSHETAHTMTYVLAPKKITLLSTRPSFMPFQLFCSWYSTTTCRMSTVTRAPTCVNCVISYLNTWSIQHNVSEFT